MRYGLGVVLMAVALLMPADASAYTLVMRNGALVDVGQAYRLDGSNVLYRGADGAWRTIAVAYVDLDATARANGETVSAFVERASRRPAAQAAAQASEPSGPSVKVTNADLEPYRAERERLDAEYRARNPSVALPAVAAPFPRASGPAPAVASISGWREEARALRDQMDAERAQIDAIRREVSVRDANPFDYALSYRYNYGNAPLVRSGGGYYGYGSQTYLRASEEFAQLSSRLIDLEIQHRATLSRWYNFLEDARRAGIPEKYLLDY